MPGLQVGVGKRCLHLLQLQVGKPLQQGCMSAERVTHIAVSGLMQGQGSYGVNCEPNCSS